MKIRIEQEFILDSSANLVQMAIESAKCRDQRHQIIKALVERFPAVADMDLEDLLQFIAVLPNMHDVQATEDRLTREHFKIKDELTRLQKELVERRIRGPKPVGYFDMNEDINSKLNRAVAACEAVADARPLMSDGSLSNEIENAIEKCLEVAYGADRPYPPALKPVQAISVGGAMFVSGGDTEP